MSDNINNSRGHAFYSLREKAWHGLGTVVQDARNSEEVIKLAKLDYNVIKAPVYAKFERELNIAVIDKNGQQSTLKKRGEIVQNAYVTYREDTAELLMSGKVVTDRYEIIQNIDAFKWLDGLMDSANITIETAGALGRGERMFISAKLPSSYRIKGDDSEISKYLLFTNTHDGSGRIQVLFTPVRVVCNNTLTSALRGAKNKYQITHTKSAHRKLDLALETLNVYNIYEKHHIEVLNKLTDITVTDTDVDHVLYKLFLSDNELDLVIKNNNSIRGIEEISSRKLNKISALRRSIYKGIGQDSNINTAYWIMNGISHYYQNVKRYENNEIMLDTITEGEGAVVMEKYLSMTNLM